MKTNKTGCFYKVSLILMFALLSLVICIWILSSKSRQADEQYQEFLVAEGRVDSLFAQLNDSVFQSLPIPKGTQMIEMDEGGSLEHGRTLRINYSFSGRTIDDIYSEYNKFMLANEWNVTRNDDETSIISFYNKGSACLDFYGSKTRGEYQIVIYHDFFNQSFSPKLNPPFEQKACVIMV